MREYNDKVKMQDHVVYKTRDGAWQGGKVVDLIDWHGEPLFVVDDKARLTRNFCLKHEVKKSSEQLFYVASIDKDFIRMLFQDEYYYHDSIENLNEADMEYIADDVSEKIDSTFAEYVRESVKKVITFDADK